jgi:hypothetical protein
MRLIVGFGAGFATFLLAVDVRLIISPPVSEDPFPAARAASRATERRRPLVCCYPIRNDTRNMGPQFALASCNAQIRIEFGFVFLSFVGN